MNATSWVSAEEAKHLKKLAEDVEYQLFFGVGAVKRRDLKIRVARLHEEGKISREETFSLAKIIDSPADDDFEFAETLIETIINKYVSNISITESQVPEPGS